MTSPLTVSIPSLRTAAGELFAISTAADFPRIPPGVLAIGTDPASVHFNRLSPAMLGTLNARLLAIQKALFQLSHDMAAAARAYQEADAAGR